MHARCGHRAEAAVATTRTESVPRFTCMARWKRRKTRTVSDMASGENIPAAEDAFTQASDLTVFVDFLQPPGLQARDFPDGTEFDPISMAANVGHSCDGEGDDQYSHIRSTSRNPKCVNHEVHEGTRRKFLKFLNLFRELSDLRG